MSELAVSEARNRLAEAIEMARTGEPVYVTRRGRRVAVLVDAASYDALVEGAEDALDRAELVAAHDSSAAANASSSSSDRSSINSESIESSTGAASS